MEQEKSQKSPLARIWELGGGEASMTGLFVRYSRRQPVCYLVLPLISLQRESL